MRIVWRNARVFDTVRGLLARALHRLCGTWCAFRWWASAGHVKTLSISRSIFCYEPLYVNFELM